MGANCFMTVFTNYITKVQAGECGVPLTFFVSKFNNYDVAKAYLRTLYSTSVNTGVEGAKETGRYHGKFA